MSRALRLIFLLQALFAECAVALLLYARQTMLDQPPIVTVPTFVIVEMDLIALAAQAYVVFILWVLWTCRT